MQTAPNINTGALPPIEEMGPYRAAALRKLNIALSNDTGSLAPGKVCLANESMIVESTFLTEVTEWAIGYGNQVDNSLRTLRDFLAPTRSSSSRVVRLTQYDENEPWFTVDYTRVKRQPLADFAEARQRVATKTDRLLNNRGLSVLIDLDEMKDKPDWQQIHTKWMIDLLMRASVLEAVALFQAGAVPNAHTWDAASNPDLDVKQDIINTANVTGFHPNRLVLGDTGSLKRQTAYEQQLTAGSLAHAAMMSNEQIATATGVSEALINADRYQKTSSVKGEIIGSAFLLFTAQDQYAPEDATNMVRHVAPASYGNGEYAVYVTPAGAAGKKVILTVENYELLYVQHTTGIELAVIR